ncbi:major royal jelly family protein [Atopomonas sediminilitoris]|uniref:major royal jelly family protein n=1 Tax=Atopomonas sediminilitoris TaxID=2919919 RepID=UPI001F4E0A03|nr:major royal jelly family protein [Atopomonas sediminilitoris]MCJ8169187.1 major royal jelly family protein [Atopomonas sediminilitoris]
MRRALVVLLSLIGAAALGLFLRYGGGESYPDLSGPPLIPEDQLDIAASSDEPIGNVAVSADERLFFTIHPESRPEHNRLVEWRNGQAVAFPNAEIQSQLGDILGIVIDRQNQLWAVDHGLHGVKGAHLLRFDLNNNQLVERFALPRDVAGIGSFVQDLQVSSDGRWVYLADVGFFAKRAGIIVFDTQKRQARRLLDQHDSVSAENWLIQTPSKAMTFLGGLVSLKAGIDGLVLSNDDAFLYYAAMNHTSLFRVPTSALQSGNDDLVIASIERIGNKPLADGLSIDNAHGVYITDVEHGAVLRMKPDGSLSTLVKSAQIRWADALSFGPNGWLYLADSAIPEQMLRSKANMREHAPYHIFRFKAPVAGVPGH